MKIYLFNPETGVYLGEDFADEAPMERGAFVVPPDATTIAPPTVERGQLLVFNAAEQRWDIRRRPETRADVPFKAALFEKGERGCGEGDPSHNQSRHHGNDNILSTGE